MSKNIKTFVDAMKPEIDKKVSEMHEKLSELLGPGDCPDSLLAEAYEEIALLERKLEELK